MLQPEPVEIRVILNGKETFLPPHTTVDNLIQRLGLPERGIAVEVNSRIVPRGRWHEEILQQDDTIEIVQMMGGG